MKKLRFYYSEPTVTANVLLSNYGIEKIKNIRDYKRLTVCGILDTEKNTLSFGVAMCSEKDRFQKSIGRKLSEARAHDKPMAVMNVTKQNVSDVFINTAKMLEGNIFSMKQYKF